MDRGAGPDPRLATTLRALREATGRSQEDIAHSAGLTIASYGRIERGQSNPSWSSVVRIAGALGITLERVGREVERRR